MSDERPDAPNAQPGAADGRGASGRGAANRMRGGGGGGAGDPARVGRADPAAPDDSTLRILDVNLNRAREALRLIEDWARFALDDEDVATRAKAARHALRDLARMAGVERLLAARDIRGDVGRDTKTPQEGRRATAGAVVGAAFGRLSEATRGLAEWSKLVAPMAVAAPESAPGDGAVATRPAPDAPGTQAPDAAAMAERLRYEAYDLEQRLLSRGGVRRRFRDARLYVIITASSCRAGWFETAAAALRGGAGCLQLREKGLSDAELLRRARRLRELTRAHGALLILNDRPDVARLCGADGVHVGQEDLSVAQARRIAGGERLVGKSTHTLEQFAAALAEAPDYLAIGPMFPSATKPQSRVAGVQALAAVVGRTQIPLVAIGGIDAENCGAMVRAGLRRVCVCDAVAGASDPEQAARELVAKLGAGRE